MTIWPPRIRIDKRRAAKVLRDTGFFLLACVPLLIGALVAIVVTVLQALWIAVLWLVAAGIAGYEVVRPRKG